MVDARPHTGRRRNEAARQAVIDATLRVLAADGPGALTIAAIAREAGVGKATIYRWWTGIAEIALEVAQQHAPAIVPLPDTGTLWGDLVAFLTDTYAGAARPAMRSLLRTIADEALRDDAFAERFRQFTAARRGVLAELLARGVARGELPPDADVELLVEAAYGVLWYRLLDGRRPLDRALAERVAALLLGET